MFLITEDMLFFPRGHWTSTCPLGWELNTLILVSFTFEESSILQCRRLLPVAITNKNITYLSVPELENSVFLDLVLLSCTPVATNSFSCRSLQSSYTITMSSIRCWLKLPSEIQSGKETDVGRQHLNKELESLFTFTLLDFRTKQGAWHKRIQLMKGFHFPSTRTINSVRLILGSQYSLCEILNQTSPLVCFEGWNKFSVPIWSPWEPNLSRWRRRCELGLLPINFVFRNVIFLPIVFSFVLAECKWNFMRDRYKLSFPLPLAALPLARAFLRDSLRSPK